MPHALIFVVDEESIRFGVKYFVSVLVERLRKDSSGDKQN